MKLTATLTPAKTLRATIGTVGSLSAKLTAPQKVISDDRYEGEYEVIPTNADKILGTKRLVMTDDLTVKAVPSYQVSNSKGTTFIIG